MLAEKILKEIQSAYGTEFAIMRIKEICEEEIRKSTNKKAGKGKIDAYAKKILKNAKTMGSYNLHYAYTVNGYQYFCDGHRLLRLENPIETESYPVDLKPLNYEEIFGDFPKEYEIKLDIDWKDVIASYKVAKADTGKGRYLVFSFGKVEEQYYIVNAEYLTDFLKVDTDIEVWKDSGKNLPVYIKNSNNDILLLLPVSNQYNKEYNTGIHDLTTGNYYG